jgi:hypothetical protein
MSDQPLTIEQLLETECALWAQVQERLSHMTPAEAATELDTLLDNVRRAGNGSAMFVLFASAWLETSRG